MNPQLSVFDFQEQPVRVIDRDGAPWFVAADVCRVLEIANPRDALSSLDEDERATETASAIRSNVGNSDVSVSNRGMNIISESGLYALIFKSRKPQAKAFRKWVTAEVLPAIRTTGQYSAPKAGRKAAVADISQIVDPMTIPEYVSTWKQDWSFSQVVAFGNKVRLAGKAFGVPFVTTTHLGLGSIPCYPLFLCEWVERQMSARRIEEAGHGELGYLIEKCPVGTYTVDYLLDRALASGFFRDWLSEETAQTMSVRVKFALMLAKVSGRVFGAKRIRRIGRAKTRRFLIENYPA